MSLRRAAGWWVAMFAAASACHAPRLGDYSAGERELAAGRLVEALRIFDSVPVFDIRYPEARLSAAALERRLRRHKELLLHGLELRGQWRDREALTAFHTALGEWPGHVETLALIEATEGRLRVLSSLRSRAGGRVAAGDPEGQAGTPLAASEAPRAGKDRGRDDAQLPAAGSLAAPDGESVTGSGTMVETTPGPARDDEVGARGARPPQPQDPVASELSRIAGQSSAGEIEAVLQQLQRAHRQWPDDPRVTVWLARMFQQRGLMAYGNGDVVAAITDWQRALEFDPQLRAAIVLLELATAELAQRQQSQVTRER